MQDQIKLDALQAGSNHPVCGLQDPDTLPDDPCEDTTGLSDEEVNIVRLVTCAGRLQGRLQSIDYAVRQWWQAGSDCLKRKQCSDHISHTIGEIVDMLDKLLELDPVKKSEEKL